MDLDKHWLRSEMCSERDSPLKRLYRRTHAKLARLAGSGQLVWATGCELSLALIHARRPAWPGETSETILRVAPPRKTRPPDHTRVNWPVNASASGSAQVGPGGRHRWAARVQVVREPARQKAREGYSSHYTSLLRYWLTTPCAITWTNVDFLLVRFCGFQLRAISQRGTFLYNEFKNSFKTIATSPRSQRVNINYWTPSFC